MKKILLIVVAVISISTISAGTNGSDTWFGVVNVGTGYISQKHDGTDFVSRGQDNVTHTALMIDLGLYGVAIDDGILFGLNTNFTSDFNKVQNDTDINVFHTLLALSGIYYFSGDVGTGFFARADIGAALLSYADEGIFVRTNYYSDWGVGFTLGGGFAINLGETSVTINGNYSYRGIDNNGANDLPKENFDTNIITIALGLLL